MAIGKIKSLQKKTVTAGTAVAVSSSKLLVEKLKIKALPANTDNVAVGASGTLMANGFVLDAGEELPLIEGPVDLADIYVDSAVDAEGICLTYVEIKNV